MYIFCNIPLYDFTGVYDRYHYLVFHLLLKILSTIFITVYEKYELITDFFELNSLLFIITISRASYYFVAKFRIFLNNLNKQ